MAAATAAALSVSASANFHYFVVVFFALPIS